MSRAALSLGFGFALLTIGTTLTVWHQHPPRKIQRVIDWLNAPPHGALLEFGGLYSVVTRVCFLAGGFGLLLAIGFFILE